MNKEIYVFTLEQLEMLLDKAYVAGRIETLKDLDEKPFI